MIGGFPTRGTLGLREQNNHYSESSPVQVSQPGVKVEEDQIEYR